MNIDTNQNYINPMIDFLFYKHWYNNTFGTFTSLTSEKYGSNHYVDTT